MQSVGLVSKDTYWNGLNGVVIAIKVDVGSSPQVELVSIRIHGTDTPVITINKDTEAASTLDAVYHWLDSSSVLAEWYEETERYRSTLARVDLPCKFTKVSREKSLTYSLCMIEGDRRSPDRREGGDIAVDPKKGDVIVHMYVVVEYDSTKVSLTAGQDGDHRYLSSNTLRLGDYTIYTINGPVSVDTIRPVVREAVEDLIGKLKGLVEVPIVEAVPYS